MKNYIYISSVFIFLSVFIISCSNEKDKLKEDTRRIKEMDGWYTGNDKDDGYSIGMESEQYNGKPVYYLKTDGTPSRDFGTILKNFPPSDYIGKRIRLSGYIKTDKVYGTAQMWLRIDGGNSNDSYWGRTLAFDNMQNRPIRETTGWKKYEIVSDVPKESRMLFYGALLGGTGEVWISDLKFEVVGNDVPPTTWIPQKENSQ